MPQNSNSRPPVDRFDIEYVQTRRKAATDELYDVLARIIQDLFLDDTKLAENVNVAFSVAYGYRKQHQFKTSFVGYFVMKSVDELIELAVKLRFSNEMIAQLAGNLGDSLQLATAIADLYMKSESDRIKEAGARKRDRNANGGQGSDRRSDGRTAGSRRNAGADQERERRAADAVNENARRTAVES